MQLLSAILASLWPQKYRRWRYPEHPNLLLRGTVVSGMLEWIAFGFLEFMQYRKHFLAQAEHLSQGNEGTQVAALFVVSAAEFFYPLSLVLIFFSLEGLLRAISGAILDEPLPTLPLALYARLYDRLRGRRPQPLE